MTKENKESEAMLAKYERLYLNDEFSSIIDRFENNDINHRFNDDDFLQMSEVLAVSYIETKKYKKALSYIDRGLEIKNKSSSSEGEQNDDYIDDITTFIDLKIEVFHRLKNRIKEYRCIKEFLDYKQDKDILSSREEIEYNVYSWFMKIARILTFLSLAIISFYIWRIDFFSELYWIIPSAVLFTLGLSIIAVRKKVKNYIVNSMRQYL